METDAPVSISISSGVPLISIVAMNGCDQDSPRRAMRNVFSMESSDSGALPG